MMKILRSSKEGGTTAETIIILIHAHQAVTQLLLRTSATMPTAAIHPLRSTARTGAGPSPLTPRPAGTRGAPYLPPNEGAATRIPRLVVTRRYVIQPEARRTTHPDVPFRVTHRTVDAAAMLPPIQSPQRIHMPSSRAPGVGRLAVKARGLFRSMDVTSHWTATIMALHRAVLQSTSRPYLYRAMALH